MLEVIVESTESGEKLPAPVENIKLPPVPEVSLSRISTNTDPGTAANTPRLAEFSHRAREEIRREVQTIVESCFGAYNLNARIAAEERLEAGKIAGAEASKERLEAAKIMNDAAKIAADERLEAAKIAANERLEAAKLSAGQQHHCGCRLS